LRTVRIIVAENVSCIGGIWAPLLSNITEIELAWLCSVEPRTFVGLRISRVVVDGCEAEVQSALCDSCFGFETVPWAVRFESGESVTSALSGRCIEDISQVSGFVPIECQELPQLRECCRFTFGFSRFHSFDFGRGLTKIGDRAFVLCIA
jgi:hypothetical protein